ncbi:MAG: hypothetical protein ABR501_11610 [Pyrinomonadaceae bacterium]
MKKTILVFAIYASLGVLAVPVFANAIDLDEATPSLQGQCTDESKATWYADFTKFRTTDPPKAYEAAKKYLGACPEEVGDIPTYLKKWAAAYDKEARKLKLQPLLYHDKKYAEAFTLGREILNDEPENLRVLIDLGYGGYLATITSQNESFNPDSLRYARRAIQMIESGKAPESWAPFLSKDDTLAYLYNALGRLTLKNPSPETLTSLIKAAQFGSELKKDPWTYFFIVASYEAGPYTKLSADYKTRFEGKDESPESKLALANIQQVIDRMIDAYARAVALAGNDPKYQAKKKEWMENLSTWYKYRHNQSDAGLSDLISSVLSKPLPPEPTALTTLPPSATTTTAPTSGGAASSGSTAVTGAPAPAATTAAASTSLNTLPKGTATPGSTTAAKPATTVSTKVATKRKTRNNHRRH